MSAADSKPAIHCTHCGRPVAETRHTRSSYQVDYYSLRTGEVEPMTIKRGDDTAITALKLLTAYEIVTCADCYRTPHVQRQRESLFRPELPAESGS